MLILKCNELEVVKDDHKKTTCCWAAVAGQEVAPGNDHQLLQAERPQHKRTPRLLPLPPSPLHICWKEEISFSPKEICYPVEKLAGVLTLPPSTSLNLIDLPLKGEQVVQLPKKNLKIEYFQNMGLTWHQQTNNNLSSSFSTILNAIRMK